LLLQVGRDGLAGFANLPAPWFPNISNGPYFSKFLPHAILCAITKSPWISTIGNADQESQMRIRQPRRDPRYFCGVSHQSSLMVEPFNKPLQTAPLTGRPLGDFAEKAVAKLSDLLLHENAA